MQNSIFITYNPDSINEKNIAIDLFRKGRQNGYFIYLPERNYFNRLSPQTKANIDSSNWFVIFSTTNLSKTVTEEIEYALKSKKDNQVIVIYSNHNGKNIDFQGKNPIEMYIDDYDLNSLEKFKIDLFERISSDKKTQNKEGVSGLEILLGVGAAILLLGALTSKKEK
ncbi:hypothetical protein [Flavobacterium cyclinae]|uniref:hypothetical protein n=1 Tax=Flavobacterium cyclinae TaxID=2895947 RepID=UPI001E338874|nr:hypothetical protein [Flavobacterium cyclinae]UGS22293.1 hypothetical protein LOS86_06635 [Flavobacterium cyclinae]